MRGSLLWLTMLLNLSFLSPAWAENEAHEAPVLLAAEDVISTNMEGAQVCSNTAPNPHRPDRIKLAGLVAGLPDPNASYPFGYMNITPLGLAVLADDVGLLEKLFARGATLRRESDDQTILYLAAQAGSSSMIDALLRHGLHPDTREPGGVTPLMAAVSMNRLDNVQTLLKAGADANTTANNGSNALYFAVICKNQPMVNALVHSGAHPDKGVVEEAKVKGVVLPEH